jgi:hypothetical protein
MKRGIASVALLVLIALTFRATAAAWAEPTNVRASLPAPGQALVSWTQHSDADRVCLSIYQPDWTGDAWQTCLPSAAGEQQAAVAAEPGSHLFLEEWRWSSTPHVRYGETEAFTLGQAPPTATPTATAIATPPASTPTPTPAIYLPIAR